ncbi:hypothetical protein GOV13_05340 [Candidatus Pacearchaeota archaeon]|nr:hypothetical protein [Candidatus Pacearchaeota archaeon]
MRKEEIAFLAQMVDALEEAGANLEQTYLREEYEKFDQAKKMLIQIQKKISEVVK